MNIYQIVLHPLDTEYKQLVVDALPSLTLSIASAIELNEICIMMFAKQALRAHFEKLSGVDIRITEDQKSYNHVCENKGFQDVLMLGASSKVNAPSVWHVVANPLEVMLFLEVLTNFDEDGLYFDIQHPSIYTECSSDFDHDSTCTGSFSLNAETGEWTVHLESMCSALQPMFDFPETQTYIQNIMSQIIKIEDYKSQDWSFYPALQPNPVVTPC